jgi:hypothetical protein
VEKAAQSEDEERNELGGGGREKKEREVCDIAAIVS